MKIIETKFQGLLVIEPSIFKDKRGYFFESFNLKKYNDNNILANFVQDNESKSKYGVVRGLHYQLAPFAQTKLVRVITGKVLDVVVDIRKNSKTFGQVFSIELSEDNKKQLFIPKGFAHGFSVLSESAIFAYKCDNYYNKNSERSINPFDDKLKIDWKIEQQDAEVSEKDITAPNFDNAEMNF